MENRKVKHGEIYCYDFGANEGSIQNGIRPALVIQANNFNANSPTPGSWEGDTFTYDPKAKGGMTLTQKWVPGAHYWESALRILDSMLPSLLDQKLQTWLDEYFT